MQPPQSMQLCSWLSWWMRPLTSQTKNNLCAFDAWDQSLEACWEEKQTESKHVIGRLEHTTVGAEVTTLP